LRSRVGVMSRGNSDRCMVLDILVESTNNSSSRGTRWSIWQQVCRNTISYMNCRNCHRAVPLFFFGLRRAHILESGSVKMASADVLTLSSSPPRLFRAFHIPSSPAVPSPGDLFKNEPVGLRTIGRLTPHVANGATSLTTNPTFTIQPPQDLSSPETSLLVKVGSCGDQNVKSKQSKRIKEKTSSEINSAHELHLAVRDEKKKAPKRKNVSIDATGTKKGQKGNLEASITGLVTGTRITPRKPRSKEAEKPGDEDAPKEKIARKSRAKNSAQERQTKLPKPRVMKSSMVTTTDSSKYTTKSKDPELISRHFNTNAEQSKPSENHISYGLVEAVKRRTCWTPPKSTVENASISTPISGGADDTHGSPRYTSLEGRSGGFSDLFGNFAFNSGMQTPVPEKKVLGGSGTRKRKLVEMVTTNISTSKSVTAVSKSKASKKKVRTITDQATSAYARDEETSTSPAPLLQYFTVEGTNTATNDGFKIPSKPRSKSTRKISLKRGDGTAKAPLLLSPSSALKQVSNQDFVFGTSSQLAREDSPTFLRDIHAAMQVSNEMEDDPFIDTFQISTVAKIDTTENSASLAKRNLWRAAARDTGGKLLEIEIVDLVNSPAATNNLGYRCVKTAHVNPIISKGNEVWHDIEETAVNAASPGTKISSNKLSNKPPRIDPSVVSSSNIWCPGLSPKALRLAQSSNTLPDVTESSASTRQSTTKCDSDKPDYSSYTSAELAKEIATYRFKPVKNRNQMIALLERCWKGRRRTALDSLQANALLHSSSKPPSMSPSSHHEPSSPKQTRDRPKMKSVVKSPKAKTRTSSVKAINTIGYTELVTNTAPSKPAVVKRVRKRSKEPADEISDSDTPLTPSPPRRCPSQIRTPALPLQISTATTIGDSPALTPTTSQARLFEHITRAVTSAPPSKDPSNPSWHEKILLYDPIILEDLTAWLNTGALEQVGWDGEINPGDVKRWCISKSICCLWKENLRGEVRSRY
jgi:hypothetical protein